jgi:hypothetical protein
MDVRLKYILIVNVLYTNNLQYDEGWLYKNKEKIYTI